MSIYQFSEDGSATHLNFCHGPANDESCPSVRIGEVIPCAGCILSGIGANRRYPVARTATLCPVTLARVLDVDFEPARPQ